MILPTRSISYLSILVVLGAVVGKSAFAEEQDTCSCLVPNGGAGSVAASIESMTGTVMVSRPAGFTLAEKGVELGVGSRVIVGARSEAVISAGTTCRLAVPENTDVSLMPQEDAICVKLHKPLEAIAANASPTGVTYADRTLGSAESVFAPAPAAAAATGGASATTVTIISTTVIVGGTAGVGAATNTPVSE